MSEEQKNTDIVKSSGTLPTTKQEEIAELQALWNDKTLIRSLFGADIKKKSELMIFMGRGRMLGANPYNREIYPSYIKGKFTVMVARDYYVRRGQEQPNYNGHRSVAVYENDKKFTMKNGIPDHEANMLGDRGKVIGAYALGWKTDVDEPYAVWVPFKEYNQNNYMWKGKPETMIKKVADSHLFRKMFSAVFQGTYSEEEVPTDNTKQIENGEGEQSTEEVILSTVEDS